MTAARLMVLGVVKRSDQAHGYRIVQELSAWCANDWSNVGVGSIYHALNQMEREGLLRVVATEEAGSGPKRSLYTMTPSGEEAYVSLVEASLKSSDLYVLASGLAFMEALPRSRALELLKQNLASHTKEQAYVHGLPTSPTPPNPSQHPEVIGLWANYLDYYVTRLTGTISRIEAGWYKFTGE